MRPINSVLVWDLKIRLFHWILVLGFIFAYLTAEFHFGFLHTFIGYFLCLLLIARLLLGFKGSPYSKFSSFIFSSKETVSYLRSMIKGKPTHYFGHNPAGALMVFALLVTLALIFLSGLTTLAVIDFEGPLLFLNSFMDENSSYAARHLHAWLVDAALALISLHIIGVIVGSIQHKENLVKAMFTGKKKNLHTTSVEMK